jgi:hypothetical protein
MVHFTPKQVVHFAPKYTFCACGVAKWEKNHPKSTQVLIAFFIAPSANIFNLLLLRRQCTAAGRWRYVIYLP